jgi:hypothetical protein
MVAEIAELVGFDLVFLGLRGFGYQIRNRARGDFEIEGVSDELCDRFSKRHAEIDTALAKLLEEKPEIAAGDVMATRRLLAMAERARKQRDLSREELLALWESQLTRVERQEISRLRNQSTQTPSDEKGVSVAEAVEWAEEHLFDRNSVVLECQVWQEALGRARGSDFSVAELKAFTERLGYIRDAEHPGEVTKRDVLLREWEIVRTAKEGVAACHPLVANPRPANPKLDDEQRKAFDALLSSTNAVSVFRGGAGTGKSFVLRELVEQVRQPQATTAPILSRRSNDSPTLPPAADSTAWRYCLIRLRSSKSRPSEGSCRRIL